MDKIRVKVKIDLTGATPTLRLRVKKGQDPHLVDIDFSDHGLDDNGNDNAAAAKGTLVVWDCEQPAPAGSVLYFEGQGGDQTDVANYVLSFKYLDGTSANGDASLSNKRIFTPNGGVQNSRLRIKMLNRNADDDPVWFKYSLRVMYKANAATAAVPVVIDPMVRYIGR